MSVIVCILIIIICLIYEVCLSYYPEAFGEFVSSFKKDEVSTHFYQVILAERVIVGVLLVVTESIFVICVLCYRLIVFILFLQPFKKKLESIIFLMNILIIVGIASIYFFYRFGSVE